VLDAPQTSKPDNKPIQAEPVTTEASVNDISEAAEEKINNVVAPTSTKNTPRPVTMDAQQWLSIIEQADITGVVKALATHCALKEIQDNKITLLLAKEHESLMAGATVSKLTQKLKEMYGEDTDVSIDVIEETIDSPAQQTRDREAERLSQAQASLEEDDFIQALKRDMQAEIVPGSIQTKQEGES